MGLWKQRSEREGGLKTPLTVKMEEGTRSQATKVASKSWETPGDGFALELAEGPSPALTLISDQQDPFQTFACRAIS